MRRFILVLAALSSHKSRNKGRESRCGCGGSGRDCGGRRPGFGAGCLARQALLVVRAGQTTRRTAKAAAVRFAGDGIRVLGTVLTACDPETNGSGYYQGSSYDNGYYADGRAEAAHGSA